MSSNFSKVAQSGHTNGHPWWDYLREPLRRWLVWVPNSLNDSTLMLMRNSAKGNSLNAFLAFETAAKELEKTFVLSFF